MGRPRKIAAVARTWLVPLASLLWNGIRKQGSGLGLVDGRRRKSNNFNKQRSDSGQRLPSFHSDSQRAQNGREGLPRGGSREQ